MPEVLPAVVETSAVALPDQHAAGLAQREPVGLPVQAAAVVAGGIVAGAASVALVRRVATMPARRRSRRRLGRFDVVSTRSFLVDVHLLDRR